MGYGYGGRAVGTQDKWEGGRGQRQLPWMHVPRSHCDFCFSTSLQPVHTGYLQRALQGPGALGGAKGGTGVTGRWAISLDSATCLASDFDRCHPDPLVGPTRCSGTNTKLPLRVPARHKDGAFQRLTQSAFSPGCPADFQLRETTRHGPGALTRGPRS